MAYKLGIIGLGKIAQDQHLPVVAKDSNFELAAVVSSREGYRDVPHFRTPAELFRSGFVAGAPPDAYSEDGQHWGNPLYDWTAMRADGYRWWIERFRRTFDLVDLTRVDHFRGFDAYWRIPLPAEMLDARVADPEGLLDEEFDVAYAYEPLHHSGIPHAFMNSVLFLDHDRTEVHARLHHLRQQGQHREGVPNRCLSDFVAPKSTGVRDYVGGFAVTAGLGSDRLFHSVDEATRPLIAHLTEAG